MDVKSNHFAGMNLTVFIVLVQKIFEKNLGLQAAFKIQ